MSDGFRGKPWIHSMNAHVLVHVGHHLEGEHQYQDDTLQHLLVN